MNHTAADRIRDKVANQLYRKEGKKYIPVSDHYESDGWRDGWHLVKIHEGVTKRTTIYPNRAEFTTAMKDNVDKIIPIISEALEVEPQKEPRSEAASKAWKRFIKTWGDDFRLLQYKSINGIAECIIEELSKKP